MAYLDWREALAQRNEGREPRAAAAVAAGRGEWKRQVIAAYLFDGDFGVDERGRSLLDAAKFEGLVGIAGNILGGVLALVFGAKFGKARDVEFRIEDFDIGPDEAALVVRDGRILDTYHQARVAREGFIGWLKRMVGVHHRFRILMANLAPFPVEMALAGDRLITRDHEVVSGTARLTFQAQADRLANLLGLMRGANVLLADDLAAALGRDLLDRAVIPQARQFDAATLRGDPDAHQALEEVCRDAVQTLFGDLGVTLRSVTVEWAVTEAEQRAVEQRRREVAEREEDERVKRVVENFRRDFEVAEARHEMEAKELKRRDLELQLAGVKGDAALARARADLQQAEHELAQARHRHELALQRATADQDFDLAERNRERELTHRAERERLEREHVNALKDADVDRQVRLKQGMEAAKLEMIRAGATPEQIMALSAAESPEAARALAEKFKAEAARDASAAEKMLDVAKRSAENLQDQAVKFGDQMAEVAKSAALGPQGAQLPRCPACKKPVERAWITCPYCEAKL